MDGSFLPFVVPDIQLAAKKLTGFKRREFQAELTLKYCNGSARKAETLFGWVRRNWNGDGEFDSTDLVFVFQKGSYVAAAKHG